MSQRSALKKLSLSLFILILFSLLTGCEVKEKAQLLDVYSYLSCESYRDFFEPNQSRVVSKQEIIKNMVLELKIREAEINMLINEMNEEIEKDNGKREILFQEYFLSKQTFCDDVRKKVLFQIESMLDYECSGLDITEWRGNTNNTDLNPIFVRANFFWLLEKRKQDECSDIKERSKSETIKDAGIDKETGYSSIINRVRVMYRGGFWFLGLSGTDSYFVSEDTGERIKLPEGSRQVFISNDKYFVPGKPGSDKCFVESNWIENFDCSEYLFAPDLFAQIGDKIIHPLGYDRSGKIFINGEEYMDFSKKGVVHAIFPFKNDFLVEINVRGGFKDLFFNNQFIFENISRSSFGIMDDTLYVLQSQELNEPVYLEDGTKLTNRYMIFSFDGLEKRVIKEFDPNIRVNRILSMNNYIMILYQKRYATIWSIDFSQLCTTLNDDVSCIMPLKDNFPIDLINKSISTLDWWWKTYFDNESIIFVEGTPEDDKGSICRLKFRSNDEMHTFSFYIDVRSKRGKIYEDDEEYLDFSQKRNVEDIFPFNGSLLVLVSIASSPQNYSLFLDKSQLMEFFSYMTPSFINHNSNVYFFSSDYENGRYIFSLFRFDGKEVNIAKQFSYNGSGSIISVINLNESVVLFFGDGCYFEFSKNNFPDNLDFNKKYCDYGRYYYRLLDQTSSCRLVSENVVFWNGKEKIFGDYIRSIELIPGNGSESFLITYDINGETYYYRWNEKS